MSLLLIILVFFATALLVVGIGTLIINRRGQVKDRLSDIRKMSIETDPEDILKVPFTQRVLIPALNGIGHFIGRAAPQEIRLRIEKRIMHAGKPWNINFYSMLALQIFCCALFLLAFYFYYSVFIIDSSRIVIMVALITILGFFIPYAVVNSKADSRQHAVRRSLPDILDLLLISVEAGLGFDMALKKVTQQMPGPLSDEIKRALDEIRMGGNRETALRGIAKRTGVSEVSSFISSVNQAEQLGSNIASTLRVQSDYMRQKRRQRAEETAAKAPTKLLFPLLFFVFPAIFVVILGPAVLRILEFFATL